MNPAKCPAIAVLYHRDADGFASAMAFWAQAPVEHSPAFVVYKSVQYGEPFPELPKSVQHVIVLDFSYDLDTFQREAVDHGYRFTVIDHHPSAEEVLSCLGLGQPEHKTVFDSTKAACRLTWEYFCPEKPVPDIIRYVEDRDMWWFKQPQSEEFNLAVGTLLMIPTHNVFAHWYNMLAEEAISIGIPIKAFRDAQLHSRLRDVRVFTFLDYPDIPVINATDNISELGNLLLDEYPDAPFSVSYADRSGGTRSFSLRSRGEVDVGALAVTQGGGGHHNAAGFGVRYEADPEEAQTEPAPETEE